jgi:hypothetical protein
MVGETTTKETTTMSGKHTPGPWTVDADLILSAPNPAVSPHRLGWDYTVDGEGVLIVACQESLTTDWEADARLIAASPSMLEALLALVNAVDPGGDTNLEPFFIGPVAAARAAIEGATLAP